MKKTFLLLLLFFSVNAYCQPPKAKKVLAAQRVASIKRSRLKQRSDSAFKMAVRKIKVKKTN